MKLSIHKRIKSAPLLVWSVTASIAVGSGPLLAQASTEALSSPMKVGVLTLNEQLNEQKPLGLADVAGWVINSGVLVGALDKRWVGGTSLTTGNILWWLDGKTQMTAPPGSFGSWVVLGFRDGRIQKVEALSGKVLWTTSLDSFNQRGFHLSGTTLFVVTAAQILYAIDFQTGKTKWVYDGGFPDGLSIRGGTKPIVHDDKVIFGLSSGEILAVDSEGGQLVWRYNPAYNDARFHDYVGDMVVVGSRLLVTRYDGLVAAIDLTGSARKVLWQENLPGLTTSAFRGGRLYVGAINGDLYAFDVNGGRRLWRSATATSISAILPGEESLFVTASDGRLFSVNNISGDIFWHDDLGSAIASQPLIYDGAIYFPTAYKNIYVYQFFRDHGGT